MPGGAGFDPSALEFGLLDLQQQQREQLQQQQHQVRIRRHRSGNTRVLTARASFAHQSDARPAAMSADIIL